MSPIATSDARPGLRLGARASFLWLALVAAAAAQTDGAPPPNPHDECAGALVLSLGTNTLSSVGATASPTDFGCNSDPDVWLAFTPTTTQGYNFRVDPSGTATISQAFAGSCADLIDLGCNGGPTLTMPQLLAGVTYYVRINDWSGSAAFDLDVSAYSPPINDTCATALPLIVGSNPVDPTGADYDDVDACGEDRNVWYAFTPAASGAYSFTRSGTNYGEISGIFSGSCADLHTLTCGGFNGIIALTAGQTYYVAVADWTQSGPFQLDITTAPAPAAGDACSTAVAATLGANAGDTSAATFVPGGTCNTGDANFWFAFVPPTDGAYAFSLANYNGQSIASVYRGPCETPTSLGCVQSPAATFDALLAGVTYYIEIADWRRTGAFQLDIASAGPFAAGDTCATAVPASLGTNLFDATNSPSLLASDCSAPTPNVWFAFTPATSGAFRFMTGPTDDVEVSAVYSGTCGALAPFACVGEQSTTVLLTAGQTYYVEVSNWGPAGIISLDVAAGVAPANDECTGATPIGVGVIPSIGADFATASPWLACDDFTSDVWFRFTAPCTTIYAFSTCGLSTDDTVVALYSTCGALIACAEDVCGDQASVALPMTAGQSVLVRVGGEDGLPVQTGLRVSSAEAFAISFDAQPGSVAMSIKGGTPNSLYFAPLTLTAGLFPNGSFFGIDVSFFELLAQASAGLPYLGALDACGRITVGPYLGVPAGFTLYSVALDDLGSPFLRASAPVTFTTL
jgi:hypothetical protein